MTMSEYSQFLQKDVLATIIKCSVFTGFSLFAITWLFGRLGPRNSDQRRNARKKAAQKLEILGKNKLKLTEYEYLIASNLVVPDDIDVSWEDIAGLGNVIEEIKETVIFPILKNKYFNSKLTRPPKGVLLHGPPGCGKTLIAKATAKQAAATFLSLDISMLTDKWYGESQKLASAVFSLAEKLQPCIIFIDEIDSMLRTRNSQDHEATAMMKTQFMLLWDGICTDPEKLVIVMGATNRPRDLDSAILRRMPAMFKIPLPNKNQRKEILELILSGENTEGIDYEELAKLTHNFSGSDLKEVCRLASLFRFRELVKKMRSRTDPDGLLSVDDINMEEMRAITMDDMVRALTKIAKDL